MRVIAYLDEAESVLFRTNSDESRVRDAVKTAGEIDYRPSIAITRKGTSHSD